MLRYRLGTLLILLAVVATSATFADEKPDPGKALYGEWEVVEMIYRATRQDFGGANGGWFLFEPGCFLRIFDAEQRDALMRNPRRKAFLMDRCVIREHEIDFMVKDWRREERLSQSRYELQDGKLRMIWREDYGPRPDDFDAVKDPRLTLFVLEKVK